MSHYAYDGSGNSVGVLILAILLVVLTVLLTILVMHILRYRLMRRLAALTLHPDREPGHGGNAAHSRRTASEPLTAADREARYAAIERWLVSRRVRRHDAACDRLRRATAQLKRGGDPDGEDDLEAQALPSLDGVVDTSDDYGDDQESVSHDDHHGCPICMSPFLEGEIVSSSSDEACSHIYHHECIKEWLLRHTECPFCRHTFLEIDRPSLPAEGAATKPPPSPPPPTPHRAARSGAAAAGDLAFCCARHGRVAVDPRLHRLPELVPALAAALGGSAAVLVDVRELAARRGPKAVHDDHHTGDVEEAAYLEGFAADTAATCDIGDETGGEPNRRTKEGDDVEAGAP